VRVPRVRRPTGRVLLARTDPELAALWLGSRRHHEMSMEHYDCRTNGSYLYLDDQQRERAELPRLLHEVRSAQLIVQTFTSEGQPTAWYCRSWIFQDVGEGRARRDDLLAG
jgi:uncharacterized protein YndB with AHSA1/START domain